MYMEPRENNYPLLKNEDRKPSDIRQHSNHTFDLSSQPSITNDEAIQIVGGSNRFQIIAATLLILSFGINGTLIYGLAFLQDKDKVQLVCHNTDRSVGDCDWKQACKSGTTAFYEIDWSRSKHNFISDFDEVCTSTFWIDFQGTTYFIGFMIGSIIWLRLTDLYGRKKFIVAGHAAHVLFNILLLTLRNEVNLFVFLFIFGIQIAMTAHCAYLLLLELVSARHRPFFSAAVNIMDGSANIWLPFYFKYVNSWEYLYIANTVESFALMILIYFLVTESPRFLTTVRQFGKARIIYARIARVNRRPMFDAKFQNEFLSEESPAISDTPSEKKGSLKDLCRPKNKLLLPLMVVPLLWFTVDIVYYGINFGLGHLDGDIYVNGLVSGISQVIGYIISAFLADWIGRKWATTLCYGIGGIGCILYFFFQDSTAASYIFLVLGKFGAAATFTLVYLITTEMFPTVYRGTVFGIANVCARIGGIIAPLVSQITGDRYMMLVFGVLGVLSCGGSLMLRETKGKKMEDNLDSIHEVYMTEEENLDKITAADLKKIGSVKESIGSINKTSDVKSEHSSYREPKTSV